MKGYCCVDIFLQPWDLSFVIWFQLISDRLQPLHKVIQVMVKKILGFEVWLVGILHSVYF